MEPGSCLEPPSVIQEMDPARQNFGWINVQGALYNTKNDMHYRDRECFSFTILKLPVFDPRAPSASPSISVGPSSSTRSPSLAPSQVQENCNLIITELGTIENNPFSAQYIELYSDNCAGASIGDKNRLEGFLKRILTSGFKPLVLMAFSSYVLWKRGFLFWRINAIT